MTRVTIGTGALRAGFDTLGAQLRSLEFAGTELLWQAGEAWRYSAPILFPIISRLPGDELLHAGRSHSIPSHGIARTAEWQVLQHDASSATFLLASTVASRETYPYDFEFTLEVSVLGDELVVDHRILNTGLEPLPFLLGGHPAFAWPLPGAAADSAHTVRWHAGGESMRQAVNGLLPGRFDSPAVDGELVLRRELFARDAVLFDDVSPRAATYSAPGAPTVTLRFDDFPILGVWSKPVEGDFVCLEPWSAYPATADFRGDFDTLPGVELLAPAEERDYTYTIEIGAPE